MGLLLIGVLAGILIGFGVFAPSQGYFMPTYASQPRFDMVASSRPLEQKPAASRPAVRLAKAAPRTRIKSRKSLSPKKPAPVAVAKVAPPPSAKSGAAESDQPAETSDVVLDKAKASIAAKMEEPASAEFSDMKRAMRKNTLGRPIDTICGHVKGRKASGGETGERPFLYLVDGDDAYVVDGKANSAASIAYRNICK
jgi:hypothetical protein